MDRFVWEMGEFIVENVKKQDHLLLQLIATEALKANPYHDAEGRFTHAGGGISVHADKNRVWRNAEGKILSGPDQARLSKVPPAWKEVKLNPDPNGALQVKGMDGKGRTQYLYSAAHGEAAAAAKFQRLKEFHQGLPKIRKAIERDAKAGSDEAALLTLIDKTGFRVGSETDTKAAKQAYGASTLRAEHVKISGSKVTFSFTAKKGVETNKTVDDSSLAKMLSPRVAAGGQLFKATDSQVRSYLKEVSGNGFLPKDFRTWHGTNEALKFMKTLPVPGNKKEFTAAQKRVAEHVSKFLGNTPKVALDSYISPQVWSKWRTF